MTFNKNTLEFVTNPIVPMHQNPLKILCAYYNPKIDERGVHPKVALSRHDVTCVHTYKDAKDAVLTAVPPFDILLADITLPGGFVDEVDGASAHPSIFLQPYLDEQLARGIGIFAPLHFESVFESSDGYTILVSSKICWNLDGTRDWAKMLSLVLQAHSQSDKFNTREPQEGNS